VSSCRRLIEGDLLYMPSALPGLSADKASQLLQQTDKVLMQFPEVERVFARWAGRDRNRSGRSGNVRNHDSVQPRSAWPNGKTQDH